MIRRIAMLSVHTCPLAGLGGRDTGGMNGYVRQLAREWARRNKNSKYIPEPLLEAWGFEIESTL